MVPPLLIVQRELGPARRWLQALSERRGGPVEIRAAERGDKRRILELAERNARLALDQERLRSERRRQQRVEALDGLQGALGLDTIPLRIECFDISTLMGTNTVASMVVFEGGAPKKSDYRRFKIASSSNGDGESVPDDFAAMEEVLGRRMARWEQQREVSPHDKAYDPSFAALPNLIVIDGGKGQLSAGLRALAGVPRARRGRRLAGQADRGGVHPGPPRPASARPRHARAAAAPAGPRRGSPVRDHPPPDQARQGDDRLDPRRAPGRRAGAQARAAHALRLARGDPGGLTRGARGGAGTARASSPAGSTGSCTRRGFRSRACGGGPR